MRRRWRSSHKKKKKAGVDWSLSARTLVGIYTSSVVYYLSYGVLGKFVCVGLGKFCSLNLCFCFYFVIIIFGRFFFSFFLFSFFVLSRNRVFVPTLLEGFRRVSGDEDR
jgi:hypothetical protein